MKIQQTNFEIADIIVMELVNERIFMEYIQPYVKAAIKFHNKTSNLKKAIQNFQANSTCCTKHTYSLDDKNEYINKIVTIEILKYYWKQYTPCTEFTTYKHVPNEYHDIYKKKELMKRKEPEPIIEVDMTEIEIHVLAKYLTENTELKNEVNRRMLNKTWVDKTHEQLFKYVSGAWAWNTLCNEFTKYMPQKHLITSGRAYAKPDMRAHIDMFMMHVYAQNFEHFYKTEFNLRDTPPQCKYLLAPTETKYDLKLDALARNYGMSDDILDANTYMWTQEQQIGQIFGPCTKKLIRKFKQPEGNSTMKLTKIEKVIRINDQDASTYPDDQIFALILTIEKDIDKLETAKEKPKKLTAKIKAMKESVIELGKIVDDRD